MGQSFPEEFLREIHRLMDRHDVIIKEISDEDKLNDLFYLDLKPGEKNFFFVSEENEFIVEINDNIKLVEPKTLKWSLRKKRFLWGLNNLLIKYNINLKHENIRDVLNYIPR